MPILSNGFLGSYRILVSRGERRPEADLYIFGLQDPIPPFSLPLRTGDAEPLVDLQAVLNGLYDRAGYDLAIDYNRDPVPPLLEADAAWAETLVN